MNFSLSVERILILYACTVICTLSSRIMYSITFSEKRHFFPIDNETSKVVAVTVFPLCSALHLSPIKQFSKEVAAVVAYCELSSRSDIEEIHYSTRYNQ